MKLRYIVVPVGILLTSYFSFIFFYHKAPPLRVGPSPAAQSISKLFTGNVAVLQNATFSSETFLTVLRRNVQLRTYQVLSEDLKPVPFELKSSTINKIYSIDRLDVSGLQPGTDYYLKILEANAVVDVRQFRSLDVNKKDPHWAVASCARVGWLGHDFGPVSIWDQLLVQQPDALLFLGDMIYPDSAFQALFVIAIFNFIRDWVEGAEEFQHHVSAISIIV